ncbi:hypothetical protein RCL1_003489 [Eukaryota sp. TZLM3-RCL]
MMYNVSVLIKDASDNSLVPLTFEDSYMQISFTNDTIILSDTGITVFTLSLIDLQCNLLDDTRLEFVSSSGYYCAQFLTSYELTEFCNLLPFDILPSLSVSDNHLPNFVEEPEPEDATFNQSTSNPLPFFSSFSTQDLNNAIPLQAPKPPVITSTKGSLFGGIIYSDHYDEELKRKLGVYIEKMKDIEENASKWAVSVSNFLSDNPYLISEIQDVYNRKMIDKENSDVLEQIPIGTSSISPKSFGKKKYLSKCEELKSLLFSH